MKVGEGLTTLLYKNPIVTETLQDAYPGLGQNVDDLGMLRNMNWKSPIKFASWNVRSMYRTGAATIVEKELSRYGVEIAALQEVRWPGIDKYELEKGVILYSGRSDGRHEEGVGFYINKRVYSAVEEFDGINSRIARLRIKAKWFNVTLIAVHAPTEVSDEERKDQWYGELQDVLNRVPGHDMLIILGDMNAQVGKELAAFRGAIGNHSLHNESNDNGIRMITMAAEYDLVIGGSLFPHKEKHKGTWLSPDGRTTNQIDHVMVRRKYRRSLLDVRAYKGADCDSDHFLLICKIRMKLATKRAQTVKREIVNVEKLHNEEERMQYQIEVQNRFSILEEQDGESNWNEMVEVVRGAARDTLGVAERKRSKRWFDETCADAADKRRKTRTEWMADKDSVEKWNTYRVARNRACTVNRRKKREAVDRELLDIEKSRREGRMRAEFQGINGIRKGYQPRQGLIRDRNGEFLTNRGKIGNRWKEHFEELLNRPEPLDPLSSEAEQAEDEGLEEQIELEYEETPTAGEIMEVIKNLKNGKAAGIDEVTAELIKYGGVRLHEKVIAMVKGIWDVEMMPEVWNEGIMVTLHKKGDRTICDNYRGICLLSIGYKIFAKILYKRLNTHCERVLGDYQAGFRKSRSTVDQIFILRQILEKYWEFNKDNWHVFVDFKQAYDSVHRESLWKILRYFNIPDKLIRLVKMCYSNTKCRVRIGGELTDAFDVRGGLKQGCALSTLLFNLTLEWVMRQTPAGTGVRLGDVTEDRLAYADDVDFFGENWDELKGTVQTFQNAARRIGLEINQSKTKILKVSRNDRIMGNIRCGDMVLEAVESFKYLGSTVTSENRVEEEVKIRIASGARCSWALAKTLKSSILSRKTKTQIYTTIIRPIVTYGTETLRLTKELERRLEVFENGVLRQIYGPVFDPEMGAWRRRHNEELRNLTGLPPITNIIRSQRLRWAGHLARMPEDRVAKGVLRGRPEGTRPLGRPRMRWLDNVERDVGQLGLEEVEDWWEVAQDRMGWQHLVKAAMDHRGPQPVE